MSLSQEGGTLVAFMRWLGEDSKRGGYPPLSWAQIPMWRKLVVMSHLARSGGTTSEVDPTTKSGGAILYERWLPSLGVISYTWRKPQGEVAQALEGSLLSSQPINNATLSLI